MQEFRSQPAWPASVVLALSLVTACGEPAATPPPEAAAADARAAIEPGADDPDRFFPPADAELLLLGTFHFRDAGLDGYKPRFDVDILSDERQRELDEVLDRIAAWNPTVIAVEWDADRQAELDQRYAAYLAGDFEITSNETYQVGFRLGERLGHQRLWAVDADARWYEPRVDIDEWAAANGQADRLDPRWDEAYEGWYTWEDEAKTRRTLREQFLHMNREDVLLRYHGHYFVGSFGIGDGVDYPGADRTTGWYFNRNLRIFANVLRAIDRPGERIFLLIGAGHASILRHSALASPQVTLVEVAEVL